VTELFDEHLDDAFARAQDNRLEEEERNRGRKETRTCVRMNVPADLAGFGEWAGLSISFRRASRTGRSSLIASRDHWICRLVRQLDPSE
jgi:hypothetical protein